MARALGILPKNPKSGIHRHTLIVMWIKIKWSCMDKANKSHVISARFNDDEYLDVMMKITDESGTQLMKLSDFARASILSSKVVIIDSELEQYRAWIAASVGNNINQIARRLNTDAKAGILSESTYVDTLEELNKISVEMNKLLEPLK